MKGAVLQQPKNVQKPIKGSLDDQANAAPVLLVQSVSINASATFQAEDACRVESAKIITVKLEGQASFATAASA
jgi:hypothetical protein